MSENNRMPIKRHIKRASQSIETECQHLGRSLRQAYDAERIEADAELEALLTKLDAVKG